MTDAEALRALMEADRWIERVSGQRRTLPEAEELAGVEGELRGLAGALRSAQEALQPVRTAHEAAHEEGARLGARLVELEARLSTSGAAARDLAAIQREVQQVRERRGSEEDRELELLLELEPLEEAVEAVKTVAAPLVARRAQLQAQLEALRASLDEELDSLRASRAQAASALPETLRTRYEAALGRAGTSGAAQLVNGRCDGCRLSLAPLDVERARAVSDGEFAACPECGRILLP